MCLCVSVSVSVSVSVHQQGRVAVPSNTLVKRCESIFGTEVNVSPSVHQDPDGLPSTWLTLHCQRQRGL